jgi:hypothetical protein
MTISLSTPNGNDELASYAHTLNQLEAHMEADLDAPTDEPESSLISQTDAPESNYISHGDIMLWLATKTNGMYGDLRQAMQMSEDRSTLAKELKDLQTLLESEASSTAKLEATEAVLERVKGTPFEKEVTALLGTPAETMEQYADGSAATISVPAGGEVDLTDAVISEYAKEWAVRIESYVSDLDHQDKLALITIQQTVGEIRDATQLASNLLASEQQASAAVISNIRG